MPVGEGFVGEKGTYVEVWHSREILPIANPVNPALIFRGLRESACRFALSNSVWLPSN